MTPQRTAQNYDRLANHWNSDAFNRQNGIAQHRRALQFVPERGAALDVGCGSSGRIIELLLAEGFAVEGMDFSEEMIRLARTRHPDVVFYHDDICQWELPRSYDLISAWDSIWHVPMDDHEAVLTKLCRGLGDGGVLIFTSGGLDAPGEACNPCLGQPLYHAALGIPRLLELVAEEGCVCRHLEYDQHPELHLYLIVQKLPVTGS